MISACRRSAVSRALSSRGWRASRPRNRLLRRRIRRIRQPQPVPQARATAATTRADAGAAAAVSPRRWSCRITPGHAMPEDEQPYGSRDRHRRRLRVPDVARDAERHEHSHPPALRPRDRAAAVARGLEHVRIRRTTARRARRSARRPPISASAPRCAIPSCSTTGSSSRSVGRGAIDSTARRPNPMGDEQQLTRPHDDVQRRLGPRRRVLASSRHWALTFSVTATESADLAAADEHGSTRCR